MLTTTNPNPTNPNELPYWIPAYFWTGDAGDFNGALNPVYKEIGVYFPQTAAQLPSFNAHKASTFTPFTSADQATVWVGLRNFEAIIDVKFVAVDSSQKDAPGVINFLKSSSIGGGAVGTALPTSTYASGGVIIKPGYAATGSEPEGALIAHELMHALGMNHPYETAYKVNPQDNGPRWTNLSNTTTDSVPLAPGEIIGLTGFFPMPLDLAALQYLYGPSKIVRTGNDTYKLVEDNPNFVWDGVGNDTIDGAALSKGLTINLNPGTWGHVGSKADHITAPGQVTVNYGSTIENVIGSRFADVITGNAAGNRLDGGDGNDRFILGSGSDTVIGGSGLDTAELAGSRSSYTSSKNSAGNVVLSGNGAGSKTLQGVERVLFNNGKDGIAFDTNGTAGDAMKVLGAVFGKGSATNKDFLGIALFGLETLGMTRDQLSDFAINAAVGGAGASNAAVVNVLWTNLFGSAPTTAEAQPIVDLLNSGAYTRGSLTTAVGDLLDGQVHLTGIASVEFNTFNG